MPLDEDIPEAWDTMPANTSSKAFPIAAGTTEYTEVQNLFRATCPQTIIKVDHNKHMLYVKNNVLAVTSPSSCVPSSSDINKPIDQTFWIIKSNVLKIHHTGKVANVGYRLRAECTKIYFSRLLDWADPEPCVVEEPADQEAWIGAEKPSSEERETTLPWDLPQLCGRHQRIRLQQELRRKERWENDVQNTTVVIYWSVKVLSHLGLSDPRSQNPVALDFSLPGIVTQLFLNICFKL